MNINIYLEDSLAEELTMYAKQLGKSRNAIIRESIKIWLQQKTHTQWPESILKFQGIEGFPAFENHRKELLEPGDDPLL